MATLFIVLFVFFQYAVGVVDAARVQEVSRAPPCQTLIHSDVQSFIAKVAVLVKKADGSLYPTPTVASSVPSSGASNTAPSSDSTPPGLIINVSSVGAAVTVLVGGFFSWRRLLQRKQREEEEAVTITKADVEKANAARTAAIISSVKYSIRPSPPPSPESVYQSSTGRRISQDTPALCSTIPRKTEIVSESNSRPSSWTSVCAIPALPQAHLAPEQPASEHHNYGRTRGVPATWETWANLPTTRNSELITLLIIECSTENGKLCPPDI